MLVLTGLRCILKDIPTSTTAITIAPAACSAISAAAEACSAEFAVRAVVVSATIATALTT